MQLPEQIVKLISNEPYQSNEIGMSDASILVFQDKILKIQPCSEESENEYRMLSWLNRKLPVPEVFTYQIQNGKSYLLMSRCNGKMACNKKYMENPRMQVKLLTTGLKNLANIDISECPSNWSLKNKLARAKYNVENNLVDMDNVEPDTFGKNGFANPQALLQWLYDNQPSEELVLSHGDYCLPNIFFEDNAITGYIDLGKTGIADKWCDIALCYRSLSHNYSGRYHTETYSKLDDLLLFKELGVEPNWDKIRYYLLLDELF